MEDAAKSQKASQNASAEELLGILQIRRIEAQMLGRVYKTLCARYGKDEARAVLKDVIIEAAIAQGEDMARRIDHAPTLQDFFDILPLWTKDDALEIDVLVSEKNHLDFNVTRCRYSELYKELGLSEIGDLLSCNRDGAFCVGYNKKIDFKRTQTIMQGAPYCDFRYRLESDGKGQE